MARMKVKLAWIENNNARKKRFRKRKGSLLKKVSEISTLCDAGAFAIVYAPDSDEPDVWPSPSEVKELIAKLQSIPEAERSRKMTDHETYLKETIAKLEQQLRKIKRQNYEMEMNVMHDIYKVMPMYLLETSKISDLASFSEEKMKGSSKIMERLEKDLPPANVSSQAGHDDENVAGRSSSNAAGRITGGIRLMGFDIGSSSVGDNGGGEE
ncbi:agamous-like MADS-box protein AGL80 [Prunus yedoensis var. nudiflora]|uniref:Agamous-like MADS-box protein AGL80 n=1 Tax=Prunus yedoensis var. nudiflora TaxID=2094558 RepID=A0A314XW56_PRUYE|nr:agamous-like MADS-box protein AGL80 [Prunus yedoensis var. nudiflora]